MIAAIASVVLDGDAVGQVVTYVAPGFVALLGYRARYPRPDRPASETLIISVAASLPLVALVGALLPGQQQATQLGYVALLLATGFLAGYCAAALRGTQWAKQFLATAFDFRLEPNGSIYSQTLAHMSAQATVLIELKDGRQVSGCPRNGPQSEGDGINELYLLYPEVPDLEDATSTPIPGTEGIIVPISEISYIALSEDPTGGTLRAEPLDP